MFLIIVGFVYIYISQGNVETHLECGRIYTCLNKKRATFLFLNNSVKHWPILIIFGKQHHKNLNVNDYSLPTSSQSRAIAGPEKHFRRDPKHWEIFFFFLNDAFWCIFYF